MLEQSRNFKRTNNNQPMINERINYSKIRLINNTGSQIGIYSPKEALKIAQAEGLDLVVVSDKSDPPVCRIINYGKYKFTQEKKAKEARRKQHHAQLKEVKMQGN